MKKLATVVIGTALFLIPLMFGFADDAADLNQLQPLSPKEQSMYQQVKDDPSNLHVFITTRMYMRAVFRIIKDQT